MVTGRDKSLIAFPGVDCCEKREFCFAPKLCFTTRNKSYTINKSICQGK